MRDCLYTCTDINTEPGRRELGTEEELTKTFVYCCGQFFGAVRKTLHTLHTRTFLGFGTLATVV